MTTQRKQTGFTMIELIVVIVILGILAATALPKFIDLRSNAIESAANGVAGSLSSAASINYAACAALNHTRPATGPNAGKCTQIADCKDVANLMQGISGNTTGIFTMGSTTYTITTPQALTPNGTSGTCQMAAANGNATAVNVTFTGIGAGN